MSLLLLVGRSVRNERVSSSGVQETSRTTATQAQLSTPSECTMQVRLAVDTRPNFI